MVSLIASFDTKALETLYALRNDDLVQIFIWISELGRWSTVLGLMACFVLIFILHKKYAYATGLISSVFLSGAGIIFLKELVERARPDSSFQAYIEIWYSFPSAHAALAAALYGFLAYLAYCLVSPGFLRTALIGLCLLIIPLVAFSRIYLGVHYLSDILVGMTLGLFCVWIGIKVSKHLSQ